MPVAIRGTAQSGAVQNTTWNVALPSGIVADDYIIIAIMVDMRPNWTTVPSGFSLIASPTWDGNRQLFVYAKKATGSEGSSVQFVSDGVGGTPTGVYGSIAYSGVDPTTALDVASTSDDRADDADTTAPDAPSQTTVTDQAMVIGIFGARTVSGNTGTPGGGATERLDIVGSIQNAAIYIEELVKTPAGAIAMNATMTVASVWAAVQMALRPAAGGVQKVRPISDGATDGFSPSTGTELFAVLDEETPSDTDYVDSILTPEGKKFRVKLGVLNAPPAGTRTLKIRPYKHVSGGEQHNAIVRLYEGGSSAFGSGTLVQTFNLTNLDEIADTISLAITGTITKYWDLWVEYEVDVV